MVLGGQKGELSRSTLKVNNRKTCPLQRRRRWHPTPVLLPGKSHGRRSPVGCSPWGRSELDRTELLHFHFSPSCIGVGNGNPLQYSCLENPSDRGAWWAAVFGVAQSRTRLKRLSSSSSSPLQAPTEESSVTGTKKKRCTLHLSDFTFTFHFHALEKELATHSSVLAWRIPGTGEPSGLPSMGSHRVGHD